MDDIKTYGKAYYLQIIAVFLLMIVIGKLPPIGIITPYGMKILGIFIGCIIGWGFGHQIVVSILALLLVSFLGENTVTSIFSSAYGNQSLLMLLFGLMFCFGLEQTGIMNFIASWILSRKFATKGPWFVSLAFWIACCVCSALITNTLPVVILLWTMFYSVVEKLEVKHNDKWVQITLIMMGVCGFTGSVIMPYAGWNLMCYGLAQSAVETLQINFFAHTTLMIILNFCIIAILFFLGRFVLEREVHCKSIGTIVDSSEMKMTKQQKWGVFYLLLLALMMFLPNIMPKTIPGIVILAKLSTLGSFAVITILMSVTVVEGKTLIDPINVMKRIPWGLYFLLATALLLASLMTSQETGISAAIIALLNATIGNLGLIGIMAIFVAFGCLVTNAINNVVCVNIFIPVGAAIVSGMGGDANVLTALLLTVLYLGLVLPSGSALGALMHGNTEWLQATSIYKYASLGCIVVVLVCLLIGIPLGNLLF